jgi:hypothetical protein
MWIIYLLCGAIAAIVVTFIAIAIYKKSYFNSVKFLSLKCDMDAINQQRELLTGILDKYRKSVYANFSPAANQQMELQSYRTGALDQNATLPEHTYFCTSNNLQMATTYPMKLLRDFCGFTSNKGTLQELHNITQHTFNFEGRVQEFEKVRQEQIQIAMPQLPSLIKLIAKDEAMEKLGLQVDENWYIKMCPTYTFIDMSNPKKYASFILTPQKMDRLIDWLEDNPNKPKSNLNMHKEEPFNATRLNQ